jgi:hypothetical protein
MLRLLTGGYKSTFVPAAFLKYLTFLSSPINRRLITISKNSLQKENFKETDEFKNQEKYVGNCFVGIGVGRSLSGASGSGR